jgi:hypothetical protein
LLASDNFGAAAGTLHNVATGTGWGAAWQVQNNDISVPGYNIAGTTALTYSTLATSGSYAVGGDSYQTSGRALNVSATGPFSTYLTGDNIGAAGKTLWVSLLLRKDAANDDEVSVQLHASSLVTFPNPALVSVGYFGAASNNGTTRYWSLRVGGTGVPHGHGHYDRANRPFGAQTRLCCHQHGHPVRQPGFAGRQCARHGRRFGQQHHEPGLQEPGLLRRQRL